MKVLNKETLFAEKKERGLIITPRVLNKESRMPYRVGNRLIGDIELKIGKASGAWENSQRRAAFVHDIDVQSKRVANAETGYDPSDAAELFGAVYVDVMRLAAERPNYLDTFYRRVNRPNLKGADLKLRSLFPDIVIPAKFNGTNDKPPVMQAVKGLTEDIDLDFYGFEDVRALRRYFEDSTYDNFAISAADAIANFDNDLVFRIFSGSTMSNPVYPAPTYDAAHTQGYVVAPPGSPAWTRSRSVYETIIAAEDKLLTTYYNPLKKQKISLESGKLILWSGVALGREIKRIMSGRIADNNGAATEREPLDIDELVVYDGSPQNGQVYQGQPIAYNGVAANTAFLQYKTDGGAQYVSVEDWFFDTKQGQMRIEGTETAVWKYCGTFEDSVLPTTDGEGRVCGAIIKINFA